MDFWKILNKYYPIEKSEELRYIYITHAKKVTEFALELSKKHPELSLDNNFIEEAAMLHDIGIFLTNAPRIHCNGEEEYICHGYLGAELLRKEGFPRHARVCERHTGTGLTKEQIIENRWNIPHSDFTPETLEEKLICFADKFYSKTKHLETARTLEEVIESMLKISPEAAEKIDRWAQMFL